MGGSAQTPRNTPTTCSAGSNTCAPALEIPYSHHEKWDGSGYPMGYSGERIPLAARIFAVVDTWDVMRTARPYRPAYPDQAVLSHIQQQSGLAFDPQAVEVFLRMVA
jgi:response regulator RpfG family c-di-GMP phosphodiesterase